MATMFDKIKKQNGEHFAKAIRNYNNGILEIPDLDKIVKYAGRDAEPIMNYLVSLLNVQIKEHTVHQDPIQLLKIAGYNAFVADTLKKQNSIKKYFADGEELCTFKDKERYENYYIIHAVKENVANIKRKNFNTPERQDEYGTSVISIQILKTGGFISIKNRYNHTVPNSDNTFNSNPDNIIAGLADALRHKFDVDFSSTKVTVPNGYILLNDQIIKYNFEINNTYIGDNFYIKNGANEITHLATDSQIMMDYFILDLKNKKLLNPSGTGDTFFEPFNNLVQGCKKISVKKTANNERGIYLDGVCHARVRDGQIIYLGLSKVTKINDNFLLNNKKLKEISLPNVKTIGNNLLPTNKNLTDVSLPKVETIGNNFLANNKDLQKTSLPNVRKIGDFFLEHNEKLKEISLPNVEKIGDLFLRYNKELVTLSLPKVKTIGHYILGQNEKLAELSLPNVEYIGNDFLRNNRGMVKLSLPNVKIIDDNFLGQNKKLNHLDLPNLKTIGNHALAANNTLTEISLPRVEYIGGLFLRNNKKLHLIQLPNVTHIDFGFLYENINLAEISLPKVVFIGNDFLLSNKKLKKLSMPKVEEIGAHFISENNSMNQLSLPNVEKIDGYFLSSNNKITNLPMPNITEIRTGFFGIYDDKKIKKIIKNKKFTRPAQKNIFISGMKQLYDKTMLIYGNATQKNNQRN